MTRPWGGGAWNLRDSAAKATCLFCPLPFQTQAAATCRNIMDRKIAHRKKKLLDFYPLAPIFQPVFLWNRSTPQKCPRFFYRFASSAKTKGFGNLKADGCSANVVRWQLLGTQCWYRPPNGLRLFDSARGSEKAWGMENNPFIRERLAS